MCCLYKNCVYGGLNNGNIRGITVQKRKFSFKDFLNGLNFKDFLNGLKKSIMENFIFCALRIYGLDKIYETQKKIHHKHLPKF